MEIALRTQIVPQYIIDNVIEKVVKYPIYKFKREFEKSTGLMIKHFGNNKFVIIY